MSGGARNRPGMTLVEMMVALAIFSVVLTMALAALQGQTRAFSAGSERMGLLQNLRYAANVLEKDLRTVGSEVPAAQPFLVYADSMRIAFNANFASRLEHDLSAVYTDPTAPASLTTALTPARRITIPGTSFTYPDTSYLVAGTNSPAETIVFFFEADTATARADDYVLRRQVNDAAPEVVARGLVRAGDAPFFRYLRLVSPQDAPVRLDPVDDAALPLAHTVPVHQAPADTGRFAVIDSVRAVQVSFTSSVVRAGETQTAGTVSRTIYLPNAGLVKMQVCGDEPILGGALTATVVAVPGTGAPAVELTWPAAVDEQGGEEDVVRYVLWRGAAAATRGDGPDLSVPAGDANYRYLDTQVGSGDAYVYALAAQDCTPALSDLETTAPVVIP